MSRNADRRVTVGDRLKAQQASAGMILLPGGTFRMGSDRHYAEEGPAHPVKVDAFWIDAYPVTNAAFAAFVHATGYVTLAERPLEAAHYPGADPALLKPGGLVFRRPHGPVDLSDFRNWWQYVPGASWRHPHGPRSSVAGLGRHPVVQLVYEDCAAFAHWAMKDLPSEAEWEFAARGGLEGATYCWGDDFTPGGRPMANTWQGEFPWQNLRLDGHESTSPVGSFPANGYGLFDMAGNVWEWSTDWYAPRHASVAEDSCCEQVNPRGAAALQSYDPCMPSIRIPRKVIKGGSYLCAPNYCRRYRPAARAPQMIDTATCHIGFRCIRRTAAPATTLP